MRLVVLVIEEIKEVLVRLEDLKETKDQYRQEVLKVYKDQKG